MGVWAEQNAAGTDCEGGQAVSTTNELIPPPVSFAPGAADLSAKGAFRAGICKQVRLHSCELVQ